MTNSTPTRQECPRCQKSVAVKVDGSLWPHKCARFRMPERLPEQDCEKFVPREGHDGNGLGGLTTATRCRRPFAGHDAEGASMCAEHLT